MMSTKRGAKIYRFLLIVALTLFPVLFSKNFIYHKQKISQGPAPTLPQKSIVARVIDGDTIVIGNGLRVRYIGINTPETKHPKKKVEYFGKEAAEFNKRLVMDKEVTLEYDIQRFDRYGRILAYVYVDGVFVNAKLVEEGLAQVFTMPPNVKYVNLFLDLQKRARVEKRGLWS